MKVGALGVFLLPLLFACDVSKITTDIVVKSPNGRLVAMETTQHNPAMVSNDTWVHLYVIEADQLTRKQEVAHANDSDPIAIRWTSNSVLYLFYSKNHGATFRTDYYVPGRNVDPLADVEIIPHRVDRTN